MKLGLDTQGTAQMKRKVFPSIFSAQVSYPTLTLRFRVEEVKNRCLDRGKGEERQEMREEGISVKQAEPRRDH